MTAAPLTLHCSQESEVNWTDLVTNVTSLEPHRFTADFRAWLDWGAAPPDMLSVFLHEATHHSCFASPLGSALSGLALRIRRNAIRLAARSDDELEALLLDDLVRFETTLSALRPLAEGLAAFAEFDAIPKVWSRTTSNIMRWASILYMDPAQVAADMSSLPVELAIDMGLSEPIACLRRNENTLNRKSSVLLRRFAAADGYLVGYLTVKSLWRSVWYNCSRIGNETDLFLMYLISFFYHDFEFVRVLLDPSTRERKASSAIINYIAGRFDRILKVTEVEIDAYEEAVVKGEQATGIGVSAAEAGTGRSALDRLLKEVVGANETYKGDRRWFRRYASEVLARRQFMNLGSIDGEVTVTDAGMVELRVGGAPLYEGRAEQRATPGSAPGTLEVIFSMQNMSMSRAIVVSRADELVCCEIIGPEKQIASTKLAVEQTFKTRQTTLAAERGFTEFVTHVTDGLWIKYDLEHIREQAAVFDNLYTDVALRFARDYDAIDAAAASMREGGMRTLLKTPDLVKGAALLGMACSLNPNREALAKEFEALGLSLSDTVNGLERVYREHGYPPSLVDSF